MTIHKKNIYLSYQDPMFGRPTAQKTDTKNWKKNTKKKSIKLNELSALKKDK